tara:strand:+ start:1270 stop:1494 length:225 start_codon:yes stop_codon:yes gene_type:complete
VTEPSSNGVDVDPGAQQVGCRGVPNRVRAYALGFERRELIGDLPGIALHQGVNAEARYRPTTTVEKDVLLRGPS